MKLDHCILGKCVVEARLAHHNQAISLSPLGARYIPETKAWVECCRAINYCSRGLRFKSRQNLENDLYIVNVNAVSCCLYEY